MMSPTNPDSLEVVVSRVDRLGDLILALPVLGYLDAAGIKTRYLHVSEYARDIGEWAKQNGLCKEVAVKGSPLLPSKTPHKKRLVLSLVHPRGWGFAHRIEFSKLGCDFSLGPRNKLSSLWTYSKSVAQNRSSCENTEMEYNLELAGNLLKIFGVKEPPEFLGVPPLKIPESWKTPDLESPDVIVAVSNSNSAKNAPLQTYINLAREELAKENSVDFLVSGMDASFRRSELTSLPEVRDFKIRVVEGFPRVANLIAYLGAAKRVIASSTGPLHIAHAAGVEVIGLFPKTPLVQSIYRWRPQGYLHQKAVRVIDI